MEISWVVADDGRAAIVSGAQPVAWFIPQYLSADKRTVGPSAPPDRSVETYLNVQVGGSKSGADEHPDERKLSWVDQKWKTQLDAWWLFGEPVFWCSHIEPDVDDQPVMEWFMRLPAALACDQCGESIRQALLNGSTATACDSCADKDVSTTFSRTPA
jgi:hypothetical protein